MLVLISLCTGVLGLKPDTSKFSPVQPAVANSNEKAVDYYFFVQNEVTFAQGDSLVVTFPKEFLNIEMQASSCQINNLVQSCSQISSQSILISVQNNFRNFQHLEVIIPSISNPSYPTSTGYFELELLRGAQVLDSNYALGVVAIGQSVVSTQASLEVTSSTAGHLASYKFSLTSQSSFNSTIRIRFPNLFEFHSECYTPNSFLVCYFSRDWVYITPWSLQTGQKIHFEVQKVKNPAYSVPKGAYKLTLEILKANTNLVLERATIDTPYIAPGSISQLTYTQYSPSVKFVKQSTLYTHLGFYANSKLPPNASIEINYGVPILQDTCIVLSPLVSNCSAFSSTAVINSFHETPELTQIEVLIRLALGNNLPALYIETKVSQGVISTYQGTDTELENLEYLGTVFIEYSANAGETGNVKISFSTSISSNQNLSIYPPSGFYPFQACNYLLTTSNSCHWDSQKVSITLLETIDDYIVLENWKFPPKPSSSSNPLEWYIEVSGKAVTVLSDLLPPPLYSTLNYSASTNVWTRFEISLSTNLLELNLIELQFQTQDNLLNQGFPEDLGTSWNPLCPECTLTLLPNFTSVKVSNFSESVELFLKTPQTPNVPFEVVVYLKQIELNSVENVLKKETHSITFYDTQTFLENSILKFPSRELNTKTNVVLALKLPSGSTSLGDSIMVVFPKGWYLARDDLSVVVDGVTESVEAFQNKYAPYLKVTLNNSQITATQSSNITILNIETGKDSSIGEGHIYLGIINSSQDTVFYGPTNQQLQNFMPGLMDVSIEPTSLKKNSVGVTYKFNVTTANLVSGKLQIVFPEDYDLSQASCWKPCKVSSQTVTVQGPIEPGNPLLVEVYPISNPKSTLVTFILQALSDNSHLVEKASVNITLEEGFTSGKSIVTLLEFFPKTQLVQGELHLNFVLENSVPNNGYVEIEFSSSIELPFAIKSHRNCFLNFGFSSCTILQNSVVIEPLTSFEAGVQLELSVPRLLIPANCSVKITAYYHSLVLSQTPQKTTCYQPPQLGSLLQASLSFQPTNAAQTANYTFTVAPALEFSYLLVWFPPEYPNLTDSLVCFSKTTKLNHSAKSNYVLIWGFQSILEPFQVSILGVENPSSPLKTESFALATLHKNLTVVDYLDQGASATISNTPQIIDLVSVELDNYSILDLGSYTVSISLENLPYFSQVWVFFPQEFQNHLFGFNKEFNCKVLNQTCRAVNSQTNLLAVDIDDSLVLETTYLELTLGGVKSPEPTYPLHSFRVGVYEEATKALKALSYSTLSSFHTLSFQETKHRIYTDYNLQVNSGVTDTVRIQTPSSKIPLKKSLVFRPKVLSFGDKSLPRIYPEVIYFDKGKTQLEFQVTCSSFLEEGDYVIEWNMDEDSSYHEPPYSLLSLSSKNQFVVSIERIPPLVPGITSIPILVHAQMPPSNTLSIQASIKEGFRVSPIEFLPGKDTTQFKVQVDESVEPENYQIKFELLQSQQFYLETTTMTVAVQSSDTDPPELLSFLINYPRKMTSVDATIQASEPCYFYWTYGERGLKPPVKKTLVTLAQETTPNYFTSYIGSSLLYNFQISNLKPEYDYILYGTFVDQTGNEMDRVFSIEFYTSEVYNSAAFSLEFSQSVEGLSHQILSAISELLVVEETNLMITHEDFNALDFELHSSPDLPSPKDLLTYSVSHRDIEKALETYNITLTPFFNLVDSIRVIDSNRPEWYIEPSVTKVETNSVSIELALSINGTVFTQILESPSALPSSRQVTLGLGPYNEPATLQFSQNVTKKQLVTQNYSGLSPASSYVVLITAKSERTMNDKQMAEIKVITPAGSFQEELEDRAAWSFCLWSLLTINF